MRNAIEVINTIDAKPLLHRQQRLPLQRRQCQLLAPGFWQRGVAFLALMIGIAVLGTALGAAGTIWHQTQQREKERELLFVGLQYRRAIQHYYEQSTARGYPLTLEALLRDERSAGTKRYLRRPYRDPLTNSDKWGLVTAPAGGIMGVYSLAEGQPIKRSNFPTELGWTGGKPSYADWQFVYVPQGAQK